MPRISYAFFTLAVLCAISGMLLGLRMGATEDFALQPVHAHLNLLGWASLALMGGFYALDRGAPRKLAWVNFALSGTGGVLLPLGVALVVTGHTAQGMPLAIAGGSVALLGMLAFLIVVLSGWRRAAGA